MQNLREFLIENLPCHPDCKSKLAEEIDKTLCLAVQDITPTEFRNFNFLPKERQKQIEDIIISDLTIGLMIANAEANYANRLAKVN